MTAAVHISGHKEGDITLLINAHGNDIVIAVFRPYVIVLKAPEGKDPGQISVYGVVAVECVLLHKAVDASVLVFQMLYRIIQDTVDELAVYQDPLFICNELIHGALIFHQIHSFRTLFYPEELVYPVKLPTCTDLVFKLYRSVIAVGLKYIELLFPFRLRLELAPGKLVKTGMDINVAEAGIVPLGV